MKHALIAGLVMVIAISGFFSIGRLQTRERAALAPTAAPVHQDIDGPGPTPGATRASVPTPPATVVAPKRKAGVAARVAAPRAQYMVLFVVDGGQPNYLDAPGTPHLHALMQNGTRYTDAWAGLLESETPSGHASIATGSSPLRDGILSFAWAGNDNIPVDLFDPNKINHHDMERIVQKAGAPTIAGLVHHANPHAKVVALSGHKYYAADAIGGPDADVIMYYQGTKDGKYAPTAVPGHVPPQSVLADPALTYKSTHLPVGLENHLAMKLAERTFKTMHQTVTLINLPEFDWPLGHVWGASRDMKDVQKMMRDFDRDLGKLEDIYRKAGVLDKTLFVVTADHGFAPIYRTVDHDAITKAVANAGTSIISDSYHTAAYIWVKDETRAAAAASNIAALRNPYIQSVYFKERTPSGFEYVRASGADLLLAPGAEAANQHLLHTFDNGNGPDISVFFTEHAASLPGGEAPWKGDHGGADWESQHLPLVISGPGVRAGQVSSYPARLMDIAPTALTLMGIKPRGMEGIPLADAIQAPAAPLVKAQRVTGAALKPVVTSLQQEASLELAAGK